MIHHVPVKMLQVIVLVKTTANVTGHHAAKNVTNPQIAKKPAVIIAKVQKETMLVSANPDAK